MKPHTILWANIPTIIFLLFTAYMLHIGKDTFAIISFIIAILCTSTFRTKKDET